MFVVGIDRRSSARIEFSALEATEGQIIPGNEKQMAYPIDFSPMSAFRREAVMHAGRFLQRRFEEFNAHNNDHEKFRWIKTELTYPAFDNFTFAFGNQIFPVFVEIVQDGRSLLETRERERLVEAAKDNHLVPCLWKMNVTSLKPSVADRILGRNRPYGNPFNMAPTNPMSWNLWHAETGKSLDPVSFATNERIEMSEWELRNFAIGIARQEVEKKNWKVSSFCDVLQIDPQIWFEDDKGRMCWCIVRFVRNPDNDDFHKWVGYENKDPRLKPYDGFYAGVGAAPGGVACFDREGESIPLSERFSGKAPLWRGESMFVRFNGLKRIYVAD